jgi:hypothetical protein
VGQQASSTRGRAIGEDNDAIDDQVVAERPPTSRARLPSARARRPTDDAIEDEVGDEALYDDEFDD